MMRNKIVLSVFLLLLFPATIFANLEITVQPSKSWGNIETAEIESLCTNVVAHFQQYLRDEYKINEPISVYYNSRGPFIMYRDSGLHSIAISAKAENIPQFIYQFSHEVCHVLQDYEIISPGNPNLWFQESICMMASIWVLKEMYETWEQNMPIKWRKQRPGILDYVDRIMSRPGSQYYNTPEKWIVDNEDALRADFINPFTHHILVSQLSYNFLDNFEDNPQGWNAVAQIPSITGDMEVYMRDWYNTIDTEDKQFVQDLATEMGIDVLSPLEEEIDADLLASTRLTFTHESASSLVPINPLKEWDGHIDQVWERKPDGVMSKMPGYARNFAEMFTWKHWIYGAAHGFIEYDISGKDYTKFSTYFGSASRDCGGAASMQLIFYSDGVEIFKSQELYLEHHGTFFEFRIPKGTRIFMIEISALGNNGCDHYVLGEPTLSAEDILAVDESGVVVDADVNNDGVVDLDDVVIVRKALTVSVNYDTDINNDGETNILDLLLVKAKATEAIAAAAPTAVIRKRVNRKFITWGSLKQSN